MSTTSNAASGGLSFTSLLTLIFVAAKLWDKIDWAWIWVFSPMWIGLALVLSVVLGLLVVAGACYTIAGIGDLFTRGKRLKAQQARKSKFSRLGIK